MLVNMNVYETYMLSIVYGMYFMCTVPICMMMTMTMLVVEWISISSITSFFLFSCFFLSIHELEYFKVILAQFKLTHTHTHKSTCNAVNNHNFWSLIFCIRVHKHFLPFPIHIPIDFIFFFHHFIFIILCYPRHHHVLSIEHLTMVMNIHDLRISCSK